MNKRNQHEKSRPIKIAHLLPGLKIGGCERIVLNLHLAFDPALFDSTILYWDANPDMLDTPSFQKIRPHKLELPKVFSFASVRTICSYLKQSKTELLHTHLMDADLLGFCAAKFIGIPHVLTIHTYPYPFFKKHYIRYQIMTMLSSYIVCVSEAVKKHVVEVAGVRPGKTSVIYNGIDLLRYRAPVSESTRNGLRRQLGIRENAFVTGYISRIINEKGFEYLLNAVPRVIEQCSDAFFLFVGDGYLRKPLMEQARRLGMEAHVLFTGPRFDIPEMLSVMDVFVCPSLYEAFGLSVIEAMAAAKPVIGAHSTVIPELITHGKSGIIVPLRDADAIADAIIDLFNNPDKRNSFAQAAAEKARSFSMEQTARSLEKLYLSLLDKKASRPS